MMKYTKIYFRFVSQYLKMLIEYRFDFLVGVFSFFITQFTGIMFLYLVFEHIPSLNGWSFNELLFIYALFQIPRGIDHLLTDNLWLLSSYIIKGDFDKYLIRPINPLFHLLAEKFQPDAFGELLVGIGLMIYVVPTLDLNLSVINLLLLIIFIIMGTFIYSSVKLIMISLSFWIKDSKSILYAVYEFAGFARYPINIFPNVIRFILSFIIPFAFTSFFPSSYLLGKDNTTLLFMLQGMIITILLSILSYLIWNLGLKRYESSGT